MANVESPLNMALQRSSIQKEFSYVQEFSSPKTVLQIWIITTGLKYRGIT
jgi:hypothetical protein